MTEIVPLFSAHANPLNRHPSRLWKLNASRDGELDLVGLIKHQFECRIMK